MSDTALVGRRPRTAMPCDFMILLGWRSITIPASQVLRPTRLTLPALLAIAELAEGRTWDDAEAAAAAWLRAAGNTDIDVAAAIAAARERIGTERTFADAPEVASAPQAPVDGSVAHELSTPLPFVVSRQGFVYLDHDGDHSLCLRPEELAALVPLTTGAKPNLAYGMHARAAGPMVVPRARFDEILSMLAGLHLLAPVRPGGSRQARYARELTAEEERYRTMIAAVQAESAAHRAERDAIEAAGGTHLVPVVPIQRMTTAPPLALGMLLAYATHYDDGRLAEHYDLYPDWAARFDLPAVTARPSVFCFSNYLWTHEDNRDASAQIKAASPTSITIHGGPDTPSYEADVAAYFAANPHVDIAVRGEGEVTFAEILDALAGRIGDEPCDLSVLADVPGLTYRAPDGSVVRTADRDRLADLDVLPSPYLTGTFDSYARNGLAWAILESNRGCPYGCTYCDWGSATSSRIRKFDLDRVLAELEWCAEHQVQRVFSADANFGIFARDVDIARKLAQLSDERGFPRRFYTSYAKNTVKHLKEIVEVMIGSGVLTEGLLSLQSMDESTLEVIQRSNIKTERYDDLAAEFHRAGLPLFVDLMLGLPGSSVTSFREDIQRCIDREVAIKIYATELLVNSPMNRPDYREEHQVTTAGALPQLVDGGRRADKRSLVVSTATFTRDDYQVMQRDRRIVLLCETFGVLRHVARFVRQRTGLREIDLYRILSERATPQDWPAIAHTLDRVPDYMAPPGSWRYFIDEVHGFLVDELGVADDSALATVLTVQHAMLPAPDRQLPVTLTLAHDITSWHDAVIEAKMSGHRTDWPSVVPDLSSYGPGTLTIDDEAQICALNLGFSLTEGDDFTHWELTSPISRPMPAHHRAGLANAAADEG